MDENFRWQHRQWMEIAACNLEKHGFKTALFENRIEATAFLLRQAETACTVGFGGSMTLAELGLLSGVEALGKTALVHSRSGLSPQERRVVMQQQLNCDLFFTGTNAVTLDGVLVNIDATGNRVGP